MTRPLAIASRRRQSVYVADLTGPAEIGRQQNKDEKHPAHFQVKDGWHVVIAPLEEITISRQHLEVKPLPDGRFLAGQQERQPGHRPAQQPGTGPRADLSRRLCRWRSGSAPRPCACSSSRRKISPACRWPPWPPARVRRWPGCRRPSPTPGCRAWKPSNSWNGCRRFWGCCTVRPGRRIFTSRRPGPWSI